MFPPWLAAAQLALGSIISLSLVTVAVRALSRLVQLAGEVRRDRRARVVLPRAFVARRRES